MGPAGKDQVYSGTELEIFELARHWKRYFGGFMRPQLKGRVLEVGAGLGGTTASLCDGSQAEWCCLEPDSRLRNLIVKKVEQGILPPCCQALGGTVADLEAQRTFDCILYIDVLEHIAQDRAEAALAAAHLAPGGRLVIMVPAHQSLYSPYDKAIGHFRRYDKQMLTDIIPPGLACERLLYLDAVGSVLSLLNRTILKKAMPQRWDILFWDSFMIPVSKVVDRLTGFQVGKSLLGIWRKLPDET